MSGPKTKPTGVVQNARWKKSKRTKNKVGTAEERFLLGRKADHKVLAQYLPT
jgi:hypothetical protein